MTKTATPRFARCPMRPSHIERTSRRIKNAERAVAKERDDIPLFPELVRFRSADERLTHLDDVNMAYWQRQRDLEADTWRKFRARLASLPGHERARFLAYWNSHTMIPATAYYASDTLTNFLGRADWRDADIRGIQMKGGAKWR